MTDDNCMILPKEYLAMYEQPFDFTLDSGKSRLSIANVY